MLDGTILASMPMVQNRSTGPAGQVRILGKRSSARLVVAASLLASGFNSRPVISGFSCVQRAELLVYGGGGGAGLHPLGAAGSKCPG